jgi:hypothetical protein
MNYATTSPGKITRQHVFDSSSWFVHQAWGTGAQIIESECVICRLPIGAATHKKAAEVMEISHVTVQHPRGLLRWFLHNQQFPPTA